MCHRSSDSGRGYQRWSHATSRMKYTCSLQPLETSAELNSMHTSPAMFYSNYPKQSSWLRSLSMPQKPYPAGSQA
ncbi:hypothetical protein VNO77_31481 [Canavalia gladiata]|uniref:Uncharacterized protein n=1 Tax=Canavalia gladiata TaxID=3824 RepID=A0AAN9KSP9_CANGL